MAIFRFFFKMAVVRHLRFVMLVFGQPKTSILVGFTNVQILFGMDAIFSIICKSFNILLVRLEHAYSRTQNVFSAFDL